LRPFCFLGQNNTMLEDFFNNIIVLDTETTGVDDVSEIIEFSASFPNSSNDSFEDMVNYTERFKPVNGIPADASAIHFITEEDLVGHETYADGHNEFYPFFELKQYFVGHNVQFDRRMLLKNSERVDATEFAPFVDDSRWICTLKLAKKLFAEDPEFKNLTLSFLWFKFGLHTTCTRKIVPHSAEDDVYMTYKVLVHLVNIAIERGLIDTSMEIGSQVVALANTPILYSVMTIGKHKGMLMEEVPQNYLMWMIMNMDVLNSNMPNFDADLAYTVETEITRRMEDGSITLDEQPH
jgi:exodeoxyribonuclease X